MFPHKLRATSLLTFAFLQMTAAGAHSVSGRVTSPDGKGVAAAVVFVQAPLPAGSTAPTTAPPSASMDQINKTFVPNVLPIVVGTLVHFPNHDQIHHHVYSFSPTKTFELPLYKGEDAAPVRFDTVGVVKLGCNIHDWMWGIILVLPTRYFATTDQDGRFSITGLPSGTYELSAWHALSQLKPEKTAQLVQVGASEAAVVFSLPLAAPRARPAVHGARGDL